MISILGIPLDENSSFLSGASKGYRMIMNEFQSDSSNKFAEVGYDCGDSSNILDLGLMKLSTGAAAMDSIQKTVQRLQQ